MHVYVLLFNAGTENEGIHTLKFKEDGRNVVLMFESEDDAIRYGVLLEAQDFMTPTVEAIASEDVEDFCEEAGYACVLVPEGTLAVPPGDNAENLDWQPEASDASAPGTSEADASNFSTSELEAIRRRLEGLL